MSAEKTNAASGPAPPYEATRTQTPDPVLHPDQDRDINLDPYPQPMPMPQPSAYPVATPLRALQRTPAPVDCPVCGQRDVTQVQMESGKTTHGWAAILCICLCIGCLPYMLSSLKDVHHHCGECGVLLATWHNSGWVEVVRKQRE